MRPFEFMESETELYERLVRFVAQWRAGVGPRPSNRNALLLCGVLEGLADNLQLEIPNADEQPQQEALERLSATLMELPSTNVWSQHADEKRWRSATRFCRLHGEVPGPGGVPYLGCDRLAWIGDKLLSARYSLKGIWPEPGVWSGWFESSRRRH